ncbi:hypothetical protein [Sphaerisporangium corydalis]|uniref:PQQ-binding-like beta-propeller repeat protein n=1 Tax=Sphaerisporangium corydalis TaxID=1441875 RepID=A0ABV9EMA0_9ACTN|nr:hypothetical protein [Sphaerisporangium corydalis]
MRFKKAFIGLVAAGLLSGCGGDPARPEAPVGGAERPTASASSTASIAAAPKTRLPVPGLYDTTRGWESDLPGTQLTLPHSEAVAVFRGGADSGTFTVLDVASGETLWTSRTLRAPGIISPLSVTVQGQDFLVASASGVADAGVVSKGHDVTTIDILPARNSGAAVEPARHLVLDGSGVVADGGGGLLVRTEDVVTTVDPATGETKRYDLRELRPPSALCTLCHAATVVAVTSRGPLLGTESMFGSGHYWVPGGWSSGDLGAGREVFISLVAGDALVATWHDRATARDIWAVLDGATGKIRAKIDCEPPRGVISGNAKGASLSAGGRYLVREHTVFDLRQGTGHCYEETDQDQPVHLTGVTDDGVAFGVAASDDAPSGRPVVIDIATGKAEASDHTAVPFGDYAGYGLFWDDATKTMVSYPHAK